MSKFVNMAYEVGVANGEPFLRMFISAIGHSKLEVSEILRREATRTEAILLASLTGVELQQLRDDMLRDAAANIINYDLLDDQLIEPHQNDDQSTSLVVLKGNPRIAPTTDTSQIGTFLETVLKKGFSASLTCVFSTTKPGRERKKLEGKWKNIREKELRNEDSLKDQSMKKELLSHYERIRGDEGWFNSTVYLIIRADNKSQLQIAQEAICGLILSVWGNKELLKISYHLINKRIAYKLFMKRHLKKQKIHVSELAAFVNTPSQQLPVIAPIHYPVFKIPAKELVDNELPIGYAIYGGRQLHRVGLKTEWLREHLAVLGATGTGKTTVVKQLMSELSKNRNIPWWVFDVKGSEYIELLNCGPQEVLLIRPGLDSSFVLDIIDSDLDSKDRHAYTTFSILRELLRERGTSSELSPAMEKLLREAITRIVSEPEKGNSIHALFECVGRLAGDDRIGTMTKDALLNRLEILKRDPLGSILRGGEGAIKISTLMKKRVIFDLRYVAQVGGMDSARLLYNLVAKYIFDYAMQRGIRDGLHHVVVLEEANNLVPESYTRDSAADITTGESMVMLQRATGQGVIVVSTRPNISSNILANTATKIVFRLPYDSTTGGRFLSLNNEQEQYLKTLKRGRALIVTPNSEPFEIETIQPKTLTHQHISDISSSFENTPTVESEDIELPDISAKSVNLDKKSPDSISDDKQIEDTHGTIFDRIGGLASHIVAFLASKGRATEEEVSRLLRTIDSQIDSHDISDLIRDLVSLGTIERESLALVPGGVVYTLPGKGLEAVQEMISEYIIEEINNQFDVDKSSLIREGSVIHFEDKSILILPEHLKASSMEKVIDKIREYMDNLGNDVAELIVIVRGSVVAAKLRDLIEIQEGFEAVNVVSAFPSSLNKMIIEFDIDNHTSTKTPRTQLLIDDNYTESIELIDAVHGDDATSRAIKMRLWFGILQEFVDLSNGCVEWKSILEFIETTAMQSSKRRSVPLSVEDGRRALTELLADEVLVALRVGNDEKLVNLSKGVWMVNSAALRELKEKAIKVLGEEFKKKNFHVEFNHGYYDLCVDKKSYVVFPTQQELNTLLRVHSDVACRICNSKQVVCILSAKEYFDDSVPSPNNLITVTLDTGMAKLLT
jgi:hypothetical protein